MDNRKIIIIGGGLAGLTAAIHLSRAGINVLLIEKNAYPKHKVCGEYLSNEVVPYLNFLGVDIDSLKPVRITKTSISTVSGRQIRQKLPLGGIGISRYALDHLLYNTAVSSNCAILKSTVSDVKFSGKSFSVTTSENETFEAEIVLGAFGKRSNIDVKLQRSFLRKPSHWLAVKAHYSGEFPDDLVALHNFRGGYCGVSKVETGAVNVCYLADFDSFKKYKDIAEYQDKVIGENPHLKAIFKNDALFTPITISQISFEDKLPVENHMLMIGDTAGLIHPLCGNGMAMAMHSAKIASELTLDYLSGEIHSRKSLERKYAIEWETHFRRRIKTGKLIAGLLRKENTAALVMRLLTIFPSALPMIIKKTHGKPILN
ncbi:MAG: FAD-dependent oxidoreductase [Flavobacterium sp.]|nr:MAG: FAD-dependent oxidoreductase [Flavobacterium sp.]